MATDLPPPEPSQPYVNVSVLEAGHLTISENLLVKGGSPTKTTLLPSLAFFLRHSQNDKKLIFDLGIRKDWEKCPPAVVQTIKTFARVEVPVDVVESLRRGGVEPDQVDAVILSHIHVDHIGDPSLFPSSRFIVGAAAEGILAKGYAPEDTEPAAEPMFAKDLLPTVRTSYLTSDHWKPIGPFPHAHDFFGDGSVYLVDAPGHLAGHLNALVRTSSDGSWLFLGADSAHDVRLITGEKEIGTFLHPGTGSVMCLHDDVEKAKEHIDRIRRVNASPKVQVLMAHDIGWFEENRDKGVLLPGKIRPL
jgi:glyoxylase-like metal-dependent hydrolase (beta-lactamase superfamily II)